MESYESLKESVGDQKTSIIAEVADRVGIKPSTAYSWTRPPEKRYDEDAERGSGRRNFVDIAKYWMESCITLGRPKSSALAPLDHLEHHFNRIAISIPDNIKNMSALDLQAELIRCMKEVGDVVRTYEAAMKDKRLSRKEVKELDREVWEAVTRFMIFLHCAKETGK
jgi:hypothetical protein